MNPLDLLPIEILSIILVLVTKDMKNIAIIRCLSHQFDTIFEQHIKQIVFNYIKPKQLERYLESGSNTLYSTTTILEMCEKCTDNDLLKFTKLISLDSYKSTISDNSLQYFTNLTYLDINTQINITDQSIKNLVLLQKLFMYVNNIITDDSIKLLTNLTCLSIDYNKSITDRGICTLTKLKYLGLTGDKRITDFGLCQLTGLKSLLLKRNRNISTSGVLQLNLKSLALSNESLCILTTDMTQLKSLYLFGCKLPTDNLIGMLVNLRHLTISVTPQITIKSLSLLTNLKSLWSSSNILFKNLDLKLSLPKLTNITIF